jgi:hypothetical protein
LQEVENERSIGVAGAENGALAFQIGACVTTEAPITKESPIKYHLSCE